MKKYMSHKRLYINCKCIGIQQLACRNEIDCIYWECHRSIYIGIYFSIMAETFAARCIQEYISSIIDTRLWDFLLFLHLYLCPSQPLQYSPTPVSCSSFVSFISLITRSFAPPFDRVRFGSVRLIYTYPWSIVFILVTLYRCALFTLL